jgi:hypothetical protein
MNKMLEAIRARPGMYLGRHNGHFTCLEGFIGGFQCSFAASKYGHEEAGELVPHDFHKFVTEKFGERFPAGGKGYQWFIEQNASSEKEAFDLFFALLDEYDQKQSGK